MKILKIFGVVVGIHVFALILMFANPGCSSANKGAPSPADTVSNNEDPSAATAPAGGDRPNYTPVTIARGESPVSSVPSSFDPNAPAATVRFSPTRPGTPAASALEAQPVSGVTPASTYTVAKGDSLWTIAKRHHITVGELSSANNIKTSSTVRVGQKLIIPGAGVSASRGASAAAIERPAKSAATDTAVATPRSSGESVKHVVKSGETLGAIARKYQVKVGEIATANNITDPARIRPGMELIIPGWQAPASKARAAAHAATAPAADPAEQNPTPSVVTPAPEQDLDSGLKSNSDEAPVIKVEDKP